MPTNCRLLHLVRHGQERTLETLTTVSEDQPEAQQEWESYGLKKELVKVQERRPRSSMHGSSNLRTSTPHEEISRYRLCLWRTRLGNRSEPLGAQPFLALSGKPGLYRSQHREPWCSSSSWTRVAQMYLWRSGCGSQSEDQARGIMDLCRQFPMDGFHPTRHHRMERRRSTDTQQHVPLSRCVQDRCRHRICQRPTTLRHHLSGALHEYPQTNPDGYFRGSPINYAEGLKGNLLLMHGTGDDNVHYQNTESVGQPTRFAWQDILSSELPDAHPRHQRRTRHQPAPASHPHRLLQEEPVIAVSISLTKICENQRAKNQLPLGEKIVSPRGCKKFP